MDNNQSNSYVRWTWIIAIILAVILLWLFLINTGNKECCHNSIPAVVATDTTEASVDTPEAFIFSASADDFTSSGESKNIAWINNVDALKNLLSNNLTAEGSGQIITLSGAVDSEDEKLQKEIDAQAFFGAGVTIDNQITSVIESTIAEVQAPATAKVYFDSGYHRLPPDSAATLEGTVDFLKSNGHKKAIISGYHDTTGDLASNQELAKKRAQSVYDAFVAAGISADRIEMRKPISSDGGGDLNQARRVEVSTE